MCQTNRATDDGNTKWTVHRQADNGNRFVIEVAGRLEGGWVGVFDDPD